MAINKTIGTRFGIDATHHVINQIKINRLTNTLEILICGYQSSTGFSNGFDNIIYDENYFDFSVLPTSVLTKIIELKNIIEVEMINNIPKWAGGTQVDD